MKHLIMRNAVWPSFLPEFPDEHYQVFKLFAGARGYAPNECSWGSIVDGPATYDEAHDAVLENIEEVRTICHAEFGFRVFWIKNGLAHDVTQDFVTLFPEPEEE
jgi:hypothetical protein